MRPEKPYEVSWTPRDALKALATKRGCPVDGSFFDYAEEHEVSQSVSMISLHDALMVAKGKVADDISGEVRIGRYITLTRYGVIEDAEDAVWFVYDDTIGLDEATPDYRPDLDD